MKNISSVEKCFLDQFPMGFEDEIWITMKKKHSVKKIDEIFENDLSKVNMKKLLDDEKYSVIIEKSLEIIKKATVVSVFEKIAFQNFIANEPIWRKFCIGLYGLLYDFNRENFENMVEILGEYKGNKNSNAQKWTVITVFNSYNNPDEFVFIKPTTAKLNAQILGVDIEYTPKPNFNTYSKVLKMILDFKEKSEICKDQNLMITTAVLYCVSNTKK